MKNALAALFVVLIFVAAGSCKKCYKCHNECKQCTKIRPDTTLTIEVCSDKLSRDYYQEYLDSLTSPSIGWNCGNTYSTYDHEFCESANFTNADILNKSDQGYSCAPE